MLSSKLWCFIPGTEAGEVQCHTPPTDRGYASGAIFVTSSVTDLLSVGQSKLDGLSNFNGQRDFIRAGG